MRPRTLSAAAGILAAGALGACGSSDRTIAGAREVPVKLTDAGCVVTSTRLPAGPTTFKVTNDGTSAVTEAEVLQGGKILGEKENLTQGLTGSFSLTLKAGRYTLLCPNGKSSAKVTLVVT